MSKRDLSQAPEAEKKVLEFIHDLVHVEPQINRVILFGSRARGDHKGRSDFDIAIEAPSFSDEQWARFAQNLREKLPTLCGLDLIRIHQETSQELLIKIQQEGIVIYDRQ